MSESQRSQLVAVLRAGGIAVLRTDTLYGLVAVADNQSAVDRVYDVKHRDRQKSCILLVSDSSQLRNYGAEPGNIQMEHTAPTSYLATSPNAPDWLLRTNHELAYRIPDVAWLKQVIASTGPLIAPSANPEGEPPACTIAEARAYFGDAVDLYVDGGEVPSDTPPSQLIRIHDDGTVQRLR